MGLANAERLGLERRHLICGTPANNSPLHPLFLSLFLSLWHSSHISPVNKAPPLESQWTTYNNFFLECDINYPSQELMGAEGLSGCARTSRKQF